MCMQLRNQQATRSSMLSHMSLIAPPFSSLSEILHPSAGLSICLSALLDPRTVSPEPKSYARIYLVFACFFLMLCIYQNIFILPNQQIRLQR